MIKEFIGTGKTLEEATSSAKVGLNAPATADIKIEVVTMPSKKILGLFGGSDAKVKASYDDGKKENKPQPKKAENQKPQAQKKPAPKKVAPKSEPKKSAQKSSAKPSAPKQDNHDEIKESDIDINYACEYLKTMIDAFNVKDAKVSASFQNSTLNINVECDDYGIIIGHRGDTLDALQYLTSLAIKRQSDKYVRVTLNVGNYREKRVETLKNLAKKNASYVERSGRRFTFEPMNPYERRIIHTTIQEIDGVISKSIGEDQNRRVVIEPADGVKNSSPSYDRRGGNSRGRGNNQKQSAPKSDAPKKADRADLPKFGKIEVNKD